MTTLTYVNTRIPALLPQHLHYPPRTKMQSRLPTYESIGTPEDGSSRRMPWRTVSAALLFVTAVAALSRASASDARAASPTQHLELHVDNALGLTECKWDASSHLNVTFDERRRLEDSKDGVDCVLEVELDVEATISLKHHYEDHCDDVEWYIDGSDDDGFTHNHSCSVDYTCHETGLKSCGVYAGEWHHFVLACV
jgi:hypothetical protein